MAVNPVQMVLQSLMQQTPFRALGGRKPSNRFIDDLNYIIERLDPPDLSKMPIQQNMIPKIMTQLATIIDPSTMKDMMRGGFSVPPEYVPDLPMPSQQGTMPTARTPHPSDSFDAALEGGLEPGGDQGYADAYDEFLQRELFRQKIPGHLYQPHYPKDDPYSINPGLPPLGGANQENWYPGSGSLDREDQWGGGGYPGSGEGIPMY